MSDDPASGAIESTEDRALWAAGIALIIDACTRRQHGPPYPARGGRLWKPIPSDRASHKDLLKALEHVLTGGANFGSAGYIGHMDPGPPVASVLGAAASATMNNNMLSREMSPSLSALEDDLLREIAVDIFGLGDQAGGVMTSGGSLANLLSIVVARNAKLGVMRSGLPGEGAYPCILASDAAHTSIQKAAMVCGLGTEAVVSVATDAMGRMDPEALRRAIETAITKGRRPFCIVATAGTTVLGSVDPLGEIADIAGRSGCWLHVDAIYGGAVMISDRDQARLAGIERADSVAFNPHKWWYVSRTCSLAMFRQRAVWQDAFRVAAPYMAADEDDINLGEVSLQGSRETDVLKLYMTLQYYGRSRLASMIEAGNDAADHLARRLSDLEYVEMATKPDLNLVCFRPLQRDGTASDELTLRLHRWLLDEHDVFLSTPILRGTRWLRAVLLDADRSGAVIDALPGLVSEFLSTV